MVLLRVGALSSGALDAAAAFHDGILSMVLVTLEQSKDDLVLVFEPANHEYRPWRLAVVQQLAREHAPRRVNALESDDEDAIAAALGYIKQAPGLTGQLLKLDGTGAKALLSSST